MGRMDSSKWAEWFIASTAGPYQAIPQPGENWHQQGYPHRQPHEYARGGTAKLLTLFRPATGEVRATGVLSAPGVEEAKLSSSAK